MIEVAMHDGHPLQVEAEGDGPAILLPVNPWPLEGPKAEEMRKWGTDPALGRTLIDGLRDRYRVIAFDYEGHALSKPKPDTLTPDHVAADFLAIADAASAGRFAYYGYSWLALAGMQLALRTDRLSALIMGGYPPVGGPYREMLQVTKATHAMSGEGGVQWEPGSETVDGKEGDSDAKDTAKNIEKDVADTSLSSADGMANVDWSSAEGRSGSAADAASWEDFDWSAVEVAMNRDQTRQFVTLYEALQNFDDHAAQSRLSMPRLCFAGTHDIIAYGDAFGGVTVDIAGAFARNRGALEAFGWEVRALEGLDHTQAMQAAKVLPLIRPWLDAIL
ncbi:alpha/beta fold hydrolase [Cohnella sp. GCM10020058]|uniref:alpha/beta fold hydrolase n=1 Tax=Cohnella sp. GCM10020058 TaxID=3317330 RepID=UPI00362EBE3C